MEPLRGILVQGEQDYDTISNPNGAGLCRITYKCSDDGCNGEESTRITSVKGLNLFKLIGLTEDYNYIYSGDYLTSPHFPIAFSTKKRFNYSLSGRKFLDTCISHIYERNPNQWVTASSYDCSEENFENIYQSYVDLGTDR